MILFKNSLQIQLKYNFKQVINRCMAEYPCLKNYNSINLIIKSLKHTCMHAWGACYNVFQTL